MKTLLMLSLILIPNLAFAGATISFESSSDTSDPFGVTAVGDTNQAVSFVATTNAIAAIPTLCVFKSGSPADSAKISLQANSAGVPSGSDLGSVTILGSSLGTSCTTASSLGTITATLTSGTTYWLVAGRTGAVDGSNFYRWNTKVTGSTSRTYTYNGTSWTICTAGANCNGEYLYGSLLLSSTYQLWSMSVF